MSRLYVPKLHDRYLRLLGIPLSVIVLMLAQMPFLFPGRWDLYWTYTGLGIFFTVFMWEMARWIIIRVRRRFPQLSQTRQRIGWMLLLFALQFGIGQAGITWTFMTLHLAVSPSMSFFQIWLLYYCCSLFFVIVISSIYEAIYFFSQYKSVLQKAEHLKKEQARKQLEALKSRVNPHFLFNSLTTLSALIGEDPDRAGQFVDELSKVYRYLLRAGRQTMARLEEEWQFAESYAFLLKNRFEEGAFSLRRPGGDWQPRSEAAAICLPMLSLQNVLDYLVRTQHAPLHIRVDAEDRQLQIHCDNHLKTLIFDVADNDWQHLESQGARQEVAAGQLVIRLPFTGSASGS